MTNSDIKTIFKIEIGISFPEGEMSSSGLIGMLKLYEYLSKDLGRNPEPSYYMKRKMQQHIKDEFAKQTRKTNKKIVYSDKEENSLILKIKNMQLDTKKKRDMDIYYDLIGAVESKDNQDKVGFYGKYKGYLLKNILARGIRADNSQTRYIKLTKFIAKNGYFKVENDDKSIYPRISVSFNIYDTKKYKTYESSPFVEIRRQTKSICEEIANNYIRYVKNKIQNKELPPLKPNTIKYRKFLMKHKEYRGGAINIDTPFIQSGKMFNSMFAYVKLDNKLVATAK